MLQEPFAHGNSLIHQLDPRIRLMSACAYSIVVALSRSFPVLTTAALVSLAWVMLAQLPAREIIKRIIVLNSFNVLLWIVLPLTFQGPIALALGPLTIYKAGMITAAQITLKSNAILLIIMALVTTMNLSVLGHTLNWWHVPDKIVHLLLMTYRYVFLIEQEYQRLMREELVESRLAAIDSVTETLGPDGPALLSEGEIFAFLQSINAIRLVLGSMLGITDEESADEADERDTSEHHLYDFLSWILEWTVRSLSPN